MVCFWWERRRGKTTTVYNHVRKSKVKSNHHKSFENSCVCRSIAHIFVVYLICAHILYSPSIWVWFLLMLLLLMLFDFFLLLQSLNRNISPILFAWNSWLLLMLLLLLRIIFELINVFFLTWIFWQRISKMNAITDLVEFLQFSWSIAMKTGECCRMAMRCCARTHTQLIEIHNHNHNHSHNHRCIWIIKHLLWAFFLFSTWFFFLLFISFVSFTFWLAILIFHLFVRMQFILIFNAIWCFSTERQIWYCMLTL